MTTIGYGVFAPLTNAGRNLLITFGTFGIIISTLCLGVFNDLLDARINRLVETLLGPQRTSPTRVASLKLCVASALLLGLMCVMAACGSWFCELDFFLAFYGAFQAVSTVGFGDVYCGYGTIPRVLYQAIVIIPGCVFFSEYGSALSDALRMLTTAVNARAAKLAAALAGGHLATSSSVAPDPTPPSAAKTKRTSLIRRLSAIGFPIQHRYGSLVEVAVPPQCSPRCSGQPAVSGGQGDGETPEPHAAIRTASRV